jgi:hypothetical protein
MTTDPLSYTQPNIDTLDCSNAESSKINISLVYHSVKNHCSLFYFICHLAYADYKSYAESNLLTDFDPYLCTDTGKHQLTLNISKMSSVYSSYLCKQSPTLAPTISPTLSPTLSSSDVPTKSPTKSPTKVRNHHSTDMFFFIEMTDNSNRLQQRALQRSRQ